MTTFTTYLTGELYAVLRDHSTLGRVAAGSPHPALPVVSADAFERGVRTACDSRTETTALLFRVRASVLLGSVRAEASLDYLSGILIGAEIRDGLATTGRPTALIGDPALCVRYAEALRVFDVGEVPVIEDAAPRGLFEIARRAGLTASRPAMAEGTR